MIANINPLEIEGFILQQYGIKTDVVIAQGAPVIKVYNHLSLFSIIKKIRVDFSFSVHHKHHTNEYMIVLHGMTNKTGE